MLENQSTVWVVNWRREHQNSVCCRR